MSLFKHQATIMTRRAATTATPVMTSDRKAGDGEDTAVNTQNIDIVASSNIEDSVGDYRRANASACGIILQFCASGSVQRRKYNLHRLEYTGVKRGFTSSAFLKIVKTT